MFPYRCAERSTQPTRWELDEDVSDADVAGSRDWRRRRVDRLLRREAIELQHALGAAQPRPDFPADLHGPRRRRGRGLRVPRRGRQRRRCRSAVRHHRHPDRPRSRHQAGTSSGAHRRAGLLGQGCSTALEEADQRGTVSGHQLRRRDAVQQISTMEGQ